MLSVALPSVKDPEPDYPPTRLARSRRAVARAVESSPRTAHLAMADCRASPLLRALIDRLRWEVP